MPIVGGRDRDRTGDPCLQSKRGKTLTALFGVAYVEISQISALSCVPKLSRNELPEGARRCRDARRFRRFCQVASTLPRAALLG